MSGVFAVVACRQNMFFPMHSKQNIYKIFGASYQFSYAGNIDEMIEMITNELRMIPSDLKKIL
jgi:hypothetical protein